MSGLTPRLLRADMHEDTSTVTLTSGIAVKGAWVELIASSSFQCNYFNATMDEENTSNEYDIDIGIGAAGSEVVLIPNIHHHVNLTGQNIIALNIFFKIEIIAGTRIAARVAATNNTDTIQFKIHLTGTT